MAYLFQQILNGIHIGAIYALLAFGYALSHGVVRRTNLAHGAVFALTGQIAILAAVFGWQALWLTLPATVAFGIATAFLYAALIGLVLARSVLGPLADRSPNTVVAATLGAAIVMGELGRIAADTRDFWLPPLLATPVLFWRDGGFEVTLTVIQLIDIALIVLAILAGSLLLARSRFGRDWRAVCDDPLAASMCGVDTRRVFRLAIVASAMTAALAGILSALHFGNVSFGTGLVFGLKVLFVAAVGGYGAPRTAALGAAAVGMAESLWTGYFPADWRDAAIFAGLIALLVLSPHRSADSGRP